MAAAGTLMVFWDYDTQWGADRSRSPGGPKDWGALEFENTEFLLEAHARHGIPSCFAVVGAAALAGERPYHDPEQIRRIHRAGHEVGSHSFKHDWIPGLTPDALLATLRDSKDALEQCIAAQVTAFVPPWNQPFDYPKGWSFSLSERREAGRGHVHLGRLCEALEAAGYRFCRVAYRSLATHAAERAMGRRIVKLGGIEKIGGILCARLNTPGGFDQPALQALHRCAVEGGVIVAYGHPHSARSGNSQDLRHLENFLEVAAQYKRQGRIRVALPRDLN